MQEVSLYGNGNFGVLLPERSGGNRIGGESSAVVFSRDLVKRHFDADWLNRLKVADFTYGTPSQRSPPAWRDAT